MFVLGYFGYKTNQLDGQTVKTRDIYRLLKEQYPDWEIYFFDTQNFKYSKLSVLSMFKKLCQCNTLIYLPANNNLKYIFPVIFILSKICRFNIHYFVVGGWLNGFIKDLPIHKCMLHRIRGIHVETRRLKDDLQTNYGYRNIDIFPNFRFFNFTPITNESKELRLVFMARIMKQKGLDWIFNLAEYINGNNLSNEIDITFFGQLNQEDREYFMSNVKKFSFIDYKGHLQPDEIYRIISEYDVMLFPTHFYTEGLPGTVVDAYISGIPVIATEWINSHEFIDHGKSGYIIPFENGEKALIDTVMLLNNDRQLLKKMKSYVLNIRNRFAPPKIESFLNGSMINM